MPRPYLKKKIKRKEKERSIINKSMQPKVVKRVKEFTREKVMLSLQTQGGYDENVPI